MLFMFGFEANGSRNLIRAHTVYYGCIICNTLDMVVYCRTCIILRMIEKHHVYLRFIEKCMAKEVSLMFNWLMTFASSL